MFKQLDLFASVPDESPKREEIKGKEVVASDQEDSVVNNTEESLTVEIPDDPAEIVVSTIEASNDDADAMIIARQETMLPIQEKRLRPAATKSVKGKRGRKSLKAMEEESDFISIPEDAILFKKQYYSIGEVAQMFQLNSSLLRYWETEFDIIKPRKNRKGDRHFRPEDIKNLFLIHHLLRQRKYTIEGAKEYLKKNKSKAQQNFELIQRLQTLKGFLLELKAGL